MILRGFPTENFHSGINHLNLGRGQHRLGFRYLGLSLQGRNWVRGCDCLDSIKMLMYFECCVIRIVYMNSNPHLTLRSGVFTFLFHWDLLGSYDRIVRNNRGSRMRNTWWRKHMALGFNIGFIILQAWDASIWPLELVLESKLSVVTLSLPSDNWLRWEEWCLSPCSHCLCLEGVSWIKLTVCLVVRERSLDIRVILWRAGCNCIPLICLLQLLQKGVQTLVNISERDYFHIFISLIKYSITILILIRVLAPWGHCMSSSTSCAAIILICTIWLLSEILSSLRGMMVPRGLVSPLLGGIESRSIPEILWLAKEVASTHRILLETHIRGSLGMVASAWPAGTTSENWEAWLLGMKLIHEWLGWLLSKETKGLNHEFFKSSLSFPCLGKVIY